MGGFFLGGACVCESIPFPPVLNEKSGHSLGPDWKGQAFLIGNDLLR